MVVFVTVCSGCSGTLTYNTKVAFGGIRPGKPLYIRESADCIQDTGRI